MAEPGTGNTENKIGDDPQFVANLTVWEDAPSLERFVWGTVHKQFYERRAVVVVVDAALCFQVDAVHVGSGPVHTDD